MKKKMLTIVLSVFILTVGAQSFDILVTGTQNGNKTYTARNSITFGPDFSYSPSGGTLAATIQNPVVTGDITYNPFLNPETTQVNTNFAVGTTNGTLDVNLAGAATYTIPIELPPGVAGLQPSITLSYNSLNGEGIAGYGWTLEGISFITRIGKNFYNDGLKTGIELNDADRFIMDGKRLVCINGTYGTNGSQYRTEHDIYARVTCYSTNNKPTHFLAETKNGHTMQFGYTNDSDHILSGNNEILSWYLNKVTDIYGNEINYSYFRVGGQIYLGEVTYGQNLITLFYKTKNDKTSWYLKGEKIENTLLLDKIEIKYNSNLIKKYELSYNDQNSSEINYSVLNELTEYGIGNTRYNSTIFGYTSPPVVNFAAPYTNTSNQDFYTSELVAGDFNGDGKKDLLAIKPSAYTIKLFLSSGNGLFGLSSTLNFNGTYRDARVADFNGDGRDDLMLATELLDPNNNPYIRFIIFISNGSSFSWVYHFDKAKSLNFELPPKGPEETKWLRETGDDFDGDGLADLMIMNTSGNWEIHGYSYTNNTLNPPSLRFSGSLGTVTKYFTEDAKGDGKTDILAFTTLGMKLYGFSSGNFTQYYQTDNITSNHRFSFGDFNSDGKSDILVFGHLNNAFPVWKMYISTGAGYEVFDFESKSANILSENIIASDFNGDGRTDLLLFTQNSRKLLIANRQGNDFLIPAISMTDYQFIAADFNGNGRADIITTSGTAGYKYYGSNGENRLMMSSIRNGTEAITKIFYSKLSDPPFQLYQKGSGAQFPVFDLQSDFPVVERIEYSNGINGINAVSYKYEGAKVHRQGKGLLCFTKQTRVDHSTDIFTESVSDFHPTLFYPRLINTYTKYGSNNLQSKSFSWLHLTPVSGVIAPYINTVSQTDHLKGHTVGQTYSYNNSNGNLTQTVISYDNGVSETTANSYDTNTTYSWIGGRLTQSTVTYAKTGESSIARTTKYTYATDGKLKPDLVKYLEGTNWYVYKNYDYNAQGNVTQEYAYSNNGGARQTNYTYENDHIRVKTVTNPLGHVTTFTYDTYGRKATEKDYLNNTTSYAFDNFGRVTTVTQPDGFVSTTSYNWGINNFSNSFYNIQKSGNDGSLVKTWFDKLGREIRSDVLGFGGSDIYTVTEYNNKGQVYRVSEPSLNPAPTLWNVFAYDNYGRQQNITRPSGRNTAYTYGTGNSRVTETTGGVTSWKETNSQGLLTSANDEGGTITYAYYPDGNLKSINAPGGVPTTIEYDIAGNQVKLIDPSAGTIEYTWNAYGQMLTQKNAENKVAEYTYLPDGRVNTKITPEGTETYGYDTNKQLTGITNPGSAVNRGYSYDSKGRVQQITETIAGTNFSTNFTFDNLGRLSTRTHPSGIVETNNYNSNGYLASISAGGATRFTVTAMNERQQITAATYGSSLTGDFGYNSYGYPTHSKAHVSGTYRQDYRYEFNPVTGNLNWRKNQLLNLTENFTYDGLDRLLTVTGPQNLTMNYAANGNITGKSDLGTANQFIYDNSARPYRLTGLETNTNLGPVTLQQITYTSFEQPNTITESPYQATFKYNTEGQRASMVVTQNGSTILSRWYAGSRYIRETAGSTTKEFTWIGGDAYTAPCVAIKTNTGSQIYYYLLRDHLGTITHVTNASGTVQNQYSFDAWGRRRNFSNWSYTVATQTDLLPTRGFTAHEWLPWFNLYNMNGRLYDPVVGRFLSPDPIVQNPAYSQNLNRYSYVLNNPLRYNDPSGYRIRIAPGEDETYINHDALRYIGGGRIGPGSGKHWSDSFRSWQGNFFLMGQNTFNSMYGSGSWNEAAKAIYSQPWFDSGRNDNETIWKQVGFYYYDNTGRPIMTPTGMSGEFWIMEFGKYKANIAAGAGGSQISMDASHNRIGFVPLDVGSNYGAYQIANYRSNISVRGNQNQISIRASSSNTPVSGGQVVFGARASLFINGNITQTQVLANGLAVFNLPDSQNISLTVNGGWTMRYDYGGAAVPVFHPIFWPFSLNFTDNFKLK